MKALIDTNILVYAIDNSDINRHLVARKLVSSCFKEGAYISTQNIGEFYYSCKRKLSPHLLEAAKALVTAIIISKAWVKVSYDGAIVSKAIANDRGQFDFWDLVLYFTMLESRVTKIITENEKDFKQFGGIDVINPFKGAGKNVDS